LFAGNIKELGAYMETQNNDSRGKAYLFLLGMSIVSSALIAAGGIIPFFIPCNEMACLAPMAIVLGLQWILVIPATIVVIVLHNKRTRQEGWHPIYPVIRVGIPLLFNMLAAGSMLLVIFTPTLLS
jgi:hypothetical protein